MTGSHDIEFNSMCTQALIEERKLYCFVVEHFCSVVHNQIAYNALVSQCPSLVVNKSY